MRIFLRRILLLLKLSKRMVFKFMSLDALLAANNLRFSKFALRFAVDYAYIFCAVDIAN